MALTKATSNKNRFRTPRRATNTGGGDRVKKKIFDFSNGKVTLNIPHFIAIILFIGGLIWFIAAQWVFDVKSANLKNEIAKQLNDLSQELSDDNKDLILKFENLEVEINDLKNKIDNLKIRNPYLK